MKAAKYSFIGVLYTSLFFFLAGCSGGDASVSYLDAFPDFDGKRVEFTAEGLNEPVSSPFGEGMVYPLGKIELEDGGKIALIVLKDAAEPIGEVKAELIREGNRVDVLTIAEADFGYYSFGEITLPTIRVITESADDDSDGLDTVEEYRIGKSGFEKGGGK